MNCLFNSKKRSEKINVVTNYTSGGGESSSGGRHNTNEKYGPCRSL